MLLYSAKHSSRPHLTLYFVLSVSTLALHWTWFLYLKYGVGENEASKEVSSAIFNESLTGKSYLNVSKREI